eukprot:6304882-Prymnesium_polylepis.1
MQLSAWPQTRPHRWAKSNAVPLSISSGRTRSGAWRRAEDSFQRQEYEPTAAMVGWCATRL